MQLKIVLYFSSHTKTDPCTQRLSTRHIFRVPLMNHNQIQTKRQSEFFISKTHFDVNFNIYVERQLCYIHILLRRVHWNAECLK